MSAPARVRSGPRINLLPPPGETVVFDDAVKQIRSGSRFTWTRLKAFVRRVMIAESTLLAELGAWGFVASWSYSLLMYRTATLPAPIAAQFEAGPYLTMAVVGAALVVVQLVAMVADNERARALCAFAASAWLAGLAASLFAGDGRVPSGLGYVLLSFLSMLAFWRVHPRLVVSLISGAVALLRGGGSRRI